MDLAVLLGGDTLFGEKIAERLIGLGMRVVAFGGDFSAVSLRHVDFRRVSLDPLDPAMIARELDTLAAGDETVHAVILAGRVSARQPLEKVHGDDLEPFITANLDYPLRVIHRLLPQLVRSRGYLMRLGWNGRGEAPGYSLDAMVEGAWQQFFRKLFEDVRDTGVKISTVYPEPNPVSGSTTHSSRSQSALNPELVGEAVEAVFRMRESNLISEIVVRPQATREEPRIPQTFDRISVSRAVPQLPEKDNLPEPVGPIQTPQPQRPAYAPPPGEQVEEDDDIELDDEELKLLKTNIDAIERSPEQSGRRRRGRRRRGGRGRSGGQGNPGDSEDPRPKPHAEQPASDPQPRAQTPETRMQEPRRNRDHGQDPRPPRQPRLETDRDRPMSAPETTAVNKPEAAKERSPDAPAAPKKKTARKAARKRAAGKSPAPKTAEPTKAAEPATVKKKVVRRGPRAKKAMPKKQED